MSKSKSGIYDCSALKYCTTLQFSGDELSFFLLADRKDALKIEAAARSVLEPFHR